MLVRDSHACDRQTTAMRWMKSLLIGAGAFYLGLLALLYVGQRSLMYFPEPIRTDPAAVGLTQAEEITLRTADGERVIAWHIPPRDGQPVILYLHGNGGAIRYRVDRFRDLTADGTGLVALSYRGYGGSTGHPTEAGLINDAAAAYAFAVGRYGDQRLIVWGESLGSGVAVALASEHPVGRLVLEAPFSSALAIAGRSYPYVPVSWLMKDQFRSDLRIAKVTAPVIVLHGEKDNVIPIASGEQLYGLIKSPKRFVRYRDGEHENLSSFGAVEAAKKFMREAASL
jgi:uncharacterized protein